MLKTLALFVLTALVEITGCWLPYLWLRQGKSVWLLLPAAASLALFAWLLTLHPTASGRVIESGLTTRQAANATGRSDEVACQRAFINAAHKFQETAAKRGATRVSNFHSIYDRKPMHGGQYDCEVGTFHARVVFKGDLAR